MATIKVVLIKAKPNTSGEYPVTIQINHDYKTRRITLFSIHEKFFINGRISKRCDEHVKLTNIINREAAMYQSRIDELERMGGYYNVDDVMKKELVDAILLSDLILTYKSQQEYINKVASARIMQNIADAIKRFDPQVRVHDVNKRWMDRFTNFLRNQDGINADSTVGQYIKNLKTALRSDLTDFFDKNVFNYKNPSSDAEIDALTMEEMRLWQRGTIPERLEIYRDFFTFMVHCQGPRVSDALMAESKNVKNGHIHFRELKTGSRKGHGKIKKVAVNTVLASIMGKYAGMSRHYIFPLLSHVPTDPKTNPGYRKHMDSKITTVNKNLKLVAAYLGINKNVTNHVARHTFASMADHENIDIRDIQKMLNHSKLDQTISYIHRLRKSDQLNEQAAKVLGKLEEE